jgi:glycosyltransferase involved in cell wall biosynthesis
VTTQSERNGEKIHQWQKDFIKEKDIKFYSRLIKDCKFDVHFMFMEAHNELVSMFGNDPHFTFCRWDDMPVVDFLRQGHIYLYRTSNMWRDNYPRVVAEAMAAGLPVLSEPRDGCKDRIDHGNTGYYCVDYDQFLEAIRKLHRKEKHRYNMGYNAKEYAYKNLHPAQWVELMEALV